ncbi:MAG TPA: LPS export ABC transporter periplasmic protein LptC [Chitinophagaceae bacterium]|nr:LPS export ABC transporter periplasmic protein LptC [Chitinophagaceae bacterium]
MHLMFRNNFFLKALIAGACLPIASCENSVEQLNQFNGIKKIGIEEAKQVNIIYSIGEKTKAKLTAPYMLRHEVDTPYVEFTKTLHTDFYDDSLRIESKLDAHYGRYMETDSKIFLKDSVVVSNVKGDTLYCNELYWDRARVGKEFYTDKPVRIRTPTEIIDGDGLDAPQDFKSWHVINGRGTVRVSSEEFPQ